MNYNCGICGEIVDVSINTESISWYIDMDPREPISADSRCWVFHEECYEPDSILSWFRFKPTTGFYYLDEGKELWDRWNHMVSKIEVPK